MRDSVNAAASSIAFLSIMSSTTASATSSSVTATSHLPSSALSSPSPSPSPTPPHSAAGSGSGSASSVTSSSPSPSTAPSTPSAAAVSLAPSGGVLESLLARRLLLEEDLRSVERQLVELEESYMEDTAAYGNVVKGWEGFLSSKLSHKHSTAAASGSAASFHSSSGGLQHSMAAGGGEGVRRSRLPPRDRLFSSSSSTAPLRTGGLPSAAQLTAASLSTASASTGQGTQGGFSLSSGELDLSGGLDCFDSSLPPQSTYQTQQLATSYASSLSSPPVLGTGRRNAGSRRGGGMDVDDGNG